MTISLVTTACHNKIINAQNPEMKPLASFDNTRWKLIKLMGVDTVPILNKDVFIQFNKSDSTMKGYAGCNNLMGKYIVDGTNLKMGPAAMTRMICPPDNMKVEDNLAKAINATDNFQIKGEHLELRKGEVVLAEFQALYLK
jgi:heat shock protein HslJ